jgi:hypothetical protein
MDVVDMTWTRLRYLRTAHRIAAVDDSPFPASIRYRLGIRHPHLSGDDIRLVESAARQWFRLVARRPRAALSMPSVVVDDLWREFALHAREYSAFCDAAFGRPLPYRPRAATVDPATTSLLVATLGHARRDEGCGATDLPLLFRVDQGLRIRDGNCYLADCGGRGECFRAPGLICLHHLNGLGKRPEPPGIRGDPPFDDGLISYGGGA